MAAPFYDREIFRRRHLWKEFVVGSLPCTRNVFSGYTGFPSPSNINPSRFQLVLGQTNTFKRVGRLVPTQSLFMCVMRGDWGYVDACGDSWEGTKEIFFHWVRVCFMGKQKKVFNKIHKSSKRVYRKLLYLISDLPPNKVH